MGVQLAGKTLGIVGLGRVGRVVASRANAMDMRVLGYDPFLTERKAKELRIEICESVRQMLPSVDYLSVHTPLTDETRNLIGAEEIAVMKEGVRLVNCARGGIFDERAVADGLKSGRLGGVALDVYETEPCTGNPLLNMPNVLGTPHLGASTKEAQSNVAVAAAEQVIDFFRSGAMKQSLNTPLLDSQTGELCGYMNLAYRLGLLLAQVENEPQADRCTLRCEGEIAKKDCRLVFAAFAAGLLERPAGPRVNIVNSRTLLHDRGVELIEQCSSEIGDFRSLITAEMAGDAETATAAGTLLGGSIPGLVRIGHCDLECRLEGVLLVTAHSDTPGVIGKIGAVCGKHQVNIAYLSVGRGSGEPSGTQVGVLMLDSEPPAVVIDELLALEPINKAAVVHLPAAEELPFWFG
jgi:D-3-phosphoglycerate dehydrogenase